MTALLLAISAGMLIRYDGGFYSQSWKLLSTAAYGHSVYEHAAFIVRDRDGAQHFVAWPFHHQSYEATYSGALPRGTVAIIHTHPNSLPLPSDGDSELARRCGLPVYAVTRTMITRTDGYARSIVCAGDWKPPLQ